MTSTLHARPIRTAPSAPVAGGVSPSVVLQQMRAMRRVVIGTHRSPRPGLR